jgi:ribose transport system substrate-binding protein
MKSFLKLSILLAVIAIFALTSTTAISADKEFVIIAKYIHPWFDVGAEGFNDAAKEIGGIKTRYVSPRGASAEEQVKLMEDVMAEKPAGIAIAVNTPEALKPVINEAMNMGIKVVTWDDTSIDSDQLMFFGTDNYSAGVAEGEVFAELMGGKGNYIIVCHETVSSNTKERFRGIHEVLDKKPDLVQLVDEQPTGVTPASALTLIENLLSAHSDKVNGWVDTNLLGTIALHQALKERGVKPGEYKIVTWTLLPEIMKAIEEGYVQVSVRQNTYAMGYLACYGLELATQGLKPTKNFFSTGHTLATKENMSTVEEINRKKAPDMLKEMKKLWQ